MKISKLILGGFKGIKHKATIPLSPITLLFGANSTGKSSILHGLLYLHEILVNKNLDPQYSKLTGNNVFLGGFANIVHLKDLNNSITIGFELDLNDSDSPIDNYASEAELWLIENAFAPFVDMECDKWACELEIAWSSLEKRVYIKKLETFFNGQAFGQINYNPGSPGAILSKLKFIEGMGEFLLNSPVAEDSENGLPWDGIALNGEKNALPDINKRFDFSIIADELTHYYEEHPLAGKTWFEASASQALLGPLKLFAHKLKSMLHIGPLRIVPKLDYTDASLNDGWFNGKGAWDHFINTHQSMKDLINDFFSSPDFLNTEYQFNVATDEMGRKMPFVKDTESDIALTMSELGVGFSQIFPIVVSALDEKFSIVSAEQPELHIHPKWQLLLADLYLLAVEGHSDRLLLVETHSEHLMLRLLKRRMQTAEDELPSGKSPCYKDTVQIVFCEKQDKQTRILPISTTDEGEFDAPWPNGFFNERIGEL